MAQTMRCFQRLAANRGAWIRHVHRLGIGSPRKISGVFLAQTRVGQLDIGKQVKTDVLLIQDSMRRSERCLRKQKLFVCLHYVWAWLSALNTASAEQLQSLPGIGPATAKSIVDYRAKVGKINRIEEIINIKGIGEKKFEKIKDRLVV
jgi:comEA protein